MAQGGTVQFKAVTSKLVQAKRCSIEVGDAAEEQYQKLGREERDKLTQFDSKTQRVDEFYFSNLSGEKKFAELWTVIQIVLVLSHGQAPVEGSSRVNSDIMTIKMKRETLCATKLIHDSLKSEDIKPRQFVVSNKLLKYCSQAQAKYNIHLMDTQEQKKKKAAIRNPSQTTGRVRTGEEEA